MKVYSEMDLMRMAFRILEGDYVSKNNKLQDVPVVKSIVLSDLKYLVFESIGERSDDGFGWLFETGNSYSENNT